MRLEDVSAAAIVGGDAEDVATEAIRIAMSEAARRRVVLVDLLNGETPISRLVNDENPHGISDALRYGISLSHVARPYPETANLFVVPGGAESPLEPDLLSHHRWASWRSHFRSTGALLLVAAPLGPEEVPRLLDLLDAVMIVGDNPVPATRARVLGWVRTSPQGGIRQVPHVLVPPPHRPWRPSSLRNAALGLLVLVTAVAATWLFRATLVGRGLPREGVRDSLPLIVMPGDPVAPGKGAATAIDSAGVARWAVELASVNSAPGALLRVRQAVDSVPVPTYSPTLLGTTTSSWYRLVAGAYPQRQAAESLLAALRDRGVVAPGAGRVIHAPYAWVVEDSVLPEVTPERLFAWRQRGLPAYALYGAVGLARIYVGAFESEAEARLLSPMLDSLDIHATLTARVGSAR